MLAGIGILIFTSQFHVMLDDKPRIHGIDNLISIPNTIYKAIFPIDGSTHHLAALIGITTIIILLLWEKFKPRSLKLIPGALVGVVIATTIATVYRLPIQYVDVPGSLLEAIQLPTPASFPRLIQASVLIDRWSLPSLRVRKVCFQP